MIPTRPRLSVLRPIPAATLASLLVAGVPGSVLGLVNTMHDATNALPFTACNGRVGFRTSEQQENHTDLNGDGDAFDSVLQVLDLSTGIVTDVGIDASGAFACAGNLFAFGASEANQAATDLDGDGDTADSVLHVYNAASASVTNVGLPVALVAASPTLIAFGVPEASLGPAGTDLNGDGDTADVVLHVYNPASGITTNVGRATSGPILVQGTTVAFLTNEAEQGNTDLNGDGDTFDDVLQVYDALTATLTNTMRQARPDFQFDGPVIAFTVEEAENGGVSLNGDLDATDRVLHLYCLNALACGGVGVHNVGVDASGGFRLAGDLVALLTSEKHQGGVNLNPPDTDTRDDVLQVYHVSTATLTNTGFAGRDPLRVSGNFVAFAVAERSQNRTDLNGNGRTTDEVVHVYNALTNVMTNTGRAVYKLCPKAPILSFTRGPCLAVGGDWLLFATSERNQGRTDLNADGDIGDAVLEAWRLSTGTRINTGLAVSRTSGITVGASGLGALRVSERSQHNSNLNPDVDTKDDVIAVFNPATQTAAPLGRSAQPTFLVEGGSVVIKTVEKAENEDLNVDGDLDDAILMYQNF